MATRRLPSIVAGRRSSVFLRGKKIQHVPTPKAVYSRAPNSLLVFSTGILSGFAAFELFIQFRRQTNFLNNRVCLAASEENEGETGDPEPRAMSRRERRFNQFASCEYEGQVLMTAQDFLESLTENEPKC